MNSEAAPAARVSPPTPRRRDVRRHQVGRELDAAGIEPEHDSRASRPVWSWQGPEHPRVIRGRRIKWLPGCAPAPFPGRKSRPRSRSRRDAVVWQSSRRTGRSCLPVFRLRRWQPPLHLLPHSAWVTFRQAGWPARPDTMQLSRQIAAPEIFSQFFLARLSLRYLWMIAVPERANHDNASPSVGGTT